MNFAQEQRNAAEDATDRPAVQFDDIVLDYGALDGAVGLLAGLLRDKGIGVGDRVAIQLPNVPYFPVIYWAVLRLGALAVPMNPLLKADEVAYHLSDSGTRIIFGWHDFGQDIQAGATGAGAECILVKPGEFEELLMGGIDPVTEVVERADADPAIVIYSSGTTGRPKGAVLTHANLMAGAKTATELADIGDAAVSVAALPLFHVFGMNAVMNAAMLARGLITLVPRFDPTKILEVIQRDKATTFAGVPTMYAALLHHPDRGDYDVSGLSICVSGGSAMPVEVLRGFDEAFGTTILEGYGLSESTGMGSFNTVDRERKPGSIGGAVGGTEMKIVDEDGNEVAQGEPGELLMNGPFVMKEYWQRPDETAEALRGGWLHTGDIATVDEEGYYYIVDRKKELIIRGGYNVYPREIEEVLYSHPAVLEAAVIGVPHAELGEEVGAAIVLKPGIEATVDELRDYVKERIAAYKYPRVIWFLDDLPKGSTGKILKREIQQR